MRAKKIITEAYGHTYTYIDIYNVEIYIEIDIYIHIHITRMIVNLYRKMNFLLKPQQKKESNLTECQCLPYILKYNPSQV